MINKNQSRIRRAKKTRIKISHLNVQRLSVHKTNLHIYAQIFSSCGKKVLVSSSTLEKEIRQELLEKKSKGNNINAAMIIGKRIAEKAVSHGIKSVSFDRSGFKYHGRIKALAEAAKKNGLIF